MIPFDLYLAYIAASFVVVIVPGPSVTLIIANSLAHGPRAGLLNVVGSQLGLAAMVAVLVFGLASVIETMAWWFDWVRLAGALYLVWLGIRLVRSRGVIGYAPPVARSDRGFFWQGLAVAVSNPKTLLFFGAFIPQFVDPSGDYLTRTAVLGVTFMVVAAIFDGAYALLAGGTGRWLSRARVRLVSRVSGLILIAGGVWLATIRR